MSRYWSNRDDVFLLWRANTGAQRAYLLATMGVFWQGVALLVGGPGRTSGPAWRTINEMGGPDVLGAALLVICLLMSLAPMRGSQAVRNVLLLASVSQVLMCLSFIRSAVLDPNAGFVGIVNLTTISLWLISHAEIYRTVRREPDIGAAR